ncbi:enoyl-CoA hydratase/isomerase family protein [Pelagibacterium luteolum]|uniref:Enoyl-CoA hydratase n=1 Tax=Pelagibacterium luteolum TaxID=440168 RepID=A0A1G7XIW0_9HYPH|nr:enoyl-CoA hydratase-related protein [Pelagibacterium luteolum]SDG84073.1 enoyl-CoA hydratase [Pelagibacterium luteolum]
MIVLKYTEDGAIARLGLNNPPLHILTNQVRQALFDAVARIEANPDVRVVIIESVNGRAFSVGSDIKEFPVDQLGGVAKIRFEQYLLDRIERLPAVTIAKLDGPALGGGAELMLACDFRIASSRTKIGFPEILLGALPAAGGMKRLLRDLGPQRAKELVLLGEPIDASRAYDIGLINKVVDPDTLEGEVIALASRLALLPASAIRQAKRVLGAGNGTDNIDTLEAEAFGALFESSDLPEGLSAFLQKRSPDFNQK